MFDVGLVQCGSVFVVFVDGDVFDVLYVAEPREEVRCGWLASSRYVGWVGRAVCTGILFSSCVRRTAVAIEACLLRDFSFFFFAVTCGMQDVKARFRSPP